MATNDSTATTPEELAEQFPGTNRPFAVWCNSDPRVDHRKWAVNGEDGEACADFEDVAQALKAAAEMGAEWDAAAKKQAQALAQVVGHNKARTELAATAFANETWSGYGPAYFNPLIGFDDGETFTNIGDVLGFLQEILGNEKESYGSHPGARLLVQTAWAAAQYSGNLQNAIKQATEVSHE